MHEESDVQLLRDYAEGGQETAFGELVARHTDFVYSAALRQVKSPDLAGDIAQGVFTDLARKARQVAVQTPGGNSLAGWLHRSTRYAVLNYWRDTRRRLANERQAMEQLLINSESAPDWERIRPVLDEALDSLGDEDREALLLRYFKNQDYRAIGLALGVNDDTAQKRVSRAVERLREFFTKRNVAISASGLAVLISANAVHAAPVGLAATISAAAISGTATSTSTAIAATNSIAMTTIQKTFIAAALAVVAGGGIFEAREVSQLREQNQALQWQQAPLASQLQQLRRERDEATNRLADATYELDKLKKNPTEVFKLRGQVGALRQAIANADSKSPMSKLTSNPETRKAFRDQLKSTVSDLFSDLANRLKWTPEEKARFCDMFADSAMNNGDLVTQALHDRTTRSEIDQMFDTQISVFDNKLLSMIGPDGLAQFQDYTKNLISTQTVADFAGSLTGDPATVAEKKSQLLQAMQEATQSTLAAAGLPPDYQTEPMLRAANIASEEEGAQSLQLLDNIYAKAATLASSFLSADELNKFQELRSNAINTSQNELLINRSLLAPISQ